MAGDDYVMVQLSKDGADEAKGGPITVSNGRRSFTFVAGVAQRVERHYEWNGVLRRIVAPDGRFLFELAPTGAATATPAAVPAPAAAPLGQTVNVEGKK